MLLYSEIVGKHVDIQKHSDLEREDSIRRDGMYSKLSWQEVTLCFVNF